MTESGKPIETVPLSARVTGAGPALIVLHGLFGAARNWATLAGKLGDEWTVHALDLRNHGDSGWADTMGFDEMAGDVAAYMDEAGLADAAVIGHSLGGKVAMALALAAPARVAKLVVADIAPVAYASSFLPFVEAMQAIDLNRLERRSQAADELAAVVTDPQLRAFLLQNLIGRGDTLAWRLNLSALAAQMSVLGDFPESLASRHYDGPVLFLSGGASDYVLPEHHERIRRLFPMAAFDVIDGAGHWLHAENPEAFLERVRRFLA